MKLYYFDGRGRGETARLILSAAGQKFENIAIDTPEHPWPGTLKAQMPFGQVPALEVDGVFLAQSLSIARYLGHRFGLAGRTPIEHAQVDGLLQTIDEMRQPASSAFWAKDKAKMQAWHDGDLGKWLDVLEQHCAKYSPSKKWLVGDAMTVADISLYRELSELRDHPVQGVSISDVLDKHPLVCGILANVAANAGIAHWVAHRKESEW